MNTDVFIGGITARIAERARVYARVYFDSDAPLRQRRGIKSVYTFDEACLRERYGSPTTGEISAISTERITQY